jgi:hypothetical protein
MLSVLAPLDGAVNVTLAPDTGLPKLSLTVATRALPNDVFTVVLWPEPDVTTILAAGPATFVSLKLAGVLTPLADAITLKVPDTVFAVSVSLAWPVAPVVTAVKIPSVPLAPLDGARNVTLAPDTALPKLSLTVATKALPNEVLTVAFWPEPDVTVMLAAAPATFVSVKLAGVLTPLADAMTL